MTDPYRPTGFPDPDETQRQEQWRVSQPPPTQQTVARRAPAGTRAVTAIAWTAAGAVVVGSVALGVGPLAGLAGLWGGGSSGVRTTEVTEPFTSVALTSANVPVTVRYDNVPQARIIETDLAEGHLNYRVENGQLVVDHTDPGSLWRWFSNEGIDIVMPNAMAASTPDVTVRVSTASVDVLGQYGTVDLQAQTGSIDANGDFEKVLASTTTGSIDVRGSADEVRAQAQTGTVDVRPTDARVVFASASTGSVDVRIEGSTPPSEVNARTGTGSVDIRVPAGRYAVETKTGTGSTDVGVDTDATSPNRIVAETATGSIDIND